MSLLVPNQIILSMKCDSAPHTCGSSSRPTSNHDAQLLLRDGLRQSISLELAHLHLQYICECTLDGGQTSLEARGLVGLEVLMSQRNY